MSDEKLLWQRSKKKYDILILYARVADLSTILIILEWKNLFKFYYKCF